MRLLSLLSIGTLLLSACSTAIIQAHEPSEPVSCFCPVSEQQPQFPGGTDALVDFIHRHKSYPEEAAKADIRGRVFVSFLLDETGRVGDVGVLRGLGYGCDDAAVRLIRRMPRWTPGRINNRPIAVRYIIPILFGPPDPVGESLRP